MTLEELKTLAGIYERGGWKLYDGPNLSITGTEKQYLEKKHDIQPGTPEWFKRVTSKQARNRYEIIRICI